MHLIAGPTEHSACSVFGTNAAGPLERPFGEITFWVMSYSELLRVLKMERKRVDKKIAEHLKMMVLRNGTKKKLEEAIRDLTS
jgi:hypothetical protein